MNYEFQYGVAAQHRHRGAFLFVVSHMRSYSSLLCHILGSHSEIAGYSEAQQSYFGRNDLDRLARTVRDHAGDLASKRYVLDKVLHNNREIAPDILRRSDVRCLFLLRNAGDAIASILEMARSLRHTGDFSDPSLVVAYYAERLAQMERYAAHVAGRALFVESESLLDDTATLLARITQWLDLAAPLSPEYRTFRYTGLPGHGDPSPNIKAGRIVASDIDRHRGYAHVAIPDGLLERGNAAYAHCRAALAHLR